MKYFFWLALMGGLCSCSENPDLRTILHNRKAIQLMSEKKLESSQKELIEAFQYNAFQPELQLNLGLNLELQKDAEKALQQYSTAEKYAQHPFHQFIARFNRAQLLGQQKKIDEALVEYQKALEIVPDSKEVKTNIELLTQQNSSDGKNSDSKDDKKSDDSKDSKDPKDNPDDKDQKDKKDQKKDYKPNSKYQPKEFKGEMSPADIKKILDEIKQQEQKIRAEYNKKNEYKERPRDKDW